MTRKTRSDSSQYASQSMKMAAEGPPEPPEFVEIDERHMPFWYSIMDTKAYDMWTPNDLVVAASLARIQYDIQEYSRLVDQKKRLIKEGDRLNVSPIHKVLVDLQVQSATLCRTLQIHARATNGESTFQKKRNKAFSESKLINDSFHDDDDSLIASPVH